MNHEIFLSHTSDDQAIAAALGDAYKTLLGGVVEVKYSTASDLGSGISHGEDWFQWIVERVRRCDFALVLVTPNSVAKPWILWEAGAVFGAAAALGEKGVRKVRPLVYQLTSDQIPSPIRDSKANFLRGDSDREVGKLFMEAFEQYRTDLSTDQTKDFFDSHEEQKDTYLAKVREALLTAPLPPTNHVIEEWRKRLDRIFETDRMSEIDDFQEWIEIAFGQTEDGKRQPLDLRIHSRLGEIYAAGKNYGRAIDEYELARELSPRDIYILRTLGKAYLDAGQRDEARGVIDRIEELDGRAYSRNAECAALKARWFREGNDPLKAAEVVKQALDENSDSYYLANILAESCLEAGDRPGAEEAFRRAAGIIDRLDEENQWALATAANAAFFVGEIDRAKGYLQKIAKLKVQPTPGDVDVIRRGLAGIGDYVENGRRTADELAKSLT